MGIGPSTKETSLHHFRDPLLDLVDNHVDIDVVGVMLVGTPQTTKDKYLVGKRAAQWAEGMRVDGAIFSCDGWGNSHVDFINTLEEFNKRDIPIVGMTFIGKQAELVVVSKDSDTIIDVNKSTEGIETEVVGENTVTVIDCKKAVAFLKLKMNKHRL